MRLSRLALLVVPLAITPAAMSQLVYSTDFEAGAGAEWSNTTTSVTPGGFHSRFLGEFGAQTVTLSLGPQAMGEYELHFELFIIRSWDGNGPHGGGADNFQITADSENLFLTNFANYDLQPGNTQAYPEQLPPFGPGGAFGIATGAAEVDSLGYDLGGSPMDAVYHLMLHHHHMGGDLSFSFTSFQNQDISDESWGVDNMSVLAVPAPSAGGVTLMTLALIVTRRRRAC